MPTVVNGIGTWYSGKSNFHTRMGTCEFCKSYGELKSYDTTVYFVVFFIPLVPLRRKRVLDECPACHKHMALDLKKWKAQREKELTEQIQALRQDPRNFEKARNAVQAMVAFQDKKMFLLLADGLKHHLGDRAEMQDLLASAYTYFSLPRESEACLRKSLALKDDPSVRELLATSLIKQLHPEDAVPFLQHILDGRLQSRTALLLILAEGYQAKGAHTEALEALDRASQVFPSLAHDPAWQKLRKISVKYQGKNKPVRSAFFTEARPRGEGVASWMAKVPAFVGPSIAVGVLAVYLYASWSMGHRRLVYLVNGLDRPYQVEVDGRTAKIFPHRAQEIQVAEGALRVKVTDPGVSIPEQTCVVETSFWRRPFLNRTFVINPDKTAVLISEETVYAAESNPRDGASPSFDVHVGDLLYRFKGVDYAFCDFPPTMRLQSRTTRIHKRRISQLTSLPPAVVAQLLANKKGKSAARTYLINGLAADPGNETLVFLLGAQMPTEEYLNLLRPKLEVRPVLLGWHRAYQSVVERSQPGPDLEREYRQLVEKDPDNPELLYLLGRVTDNRVEAEKLLRKSTEGGKPCAYGFNALAYRRLTGGDFEAALALARQAVKLEPENPTFAGLEEEALMAAEQFDELLDRNRKAREKDPLNLVLVENQIRLLARKGEKDPARQAIATYCQQLQKGEAKERVDELKEYLDALLCYYEGDVAGFAARIGKVKGEGWQFQAAFCSGKLPEAAEALAKAKDRAPYFEALLYVAGASSPATKDFSEQHLQLAIGEWRKGDQEEKQLADCLASPRLPDPAQVCGITMHPAQKRIALAVMGTRFPSQKATYFAMAHKLNYSLAFPYRFLAEVVAKP